MCVCVCVCVHAHAFYSASALLVFAKGVDRIRLPAEYVITEVWGRGERGEGKKKRKEGRK